MTYRPSYLILLCMLALLMQGCASGQKDQSGADFQKPGETVNAVKCKSDTSIQYSSYLPKAYTSEKKWPLIICFDPHAEGLLPVNLFREEAEKQEFILIGSNNSKNGMPMDQTSSIVRALREDAIARYTVDEKSIYLIGFSGGARVAGAFAITDGTVAGIVACGAGLPNMNRQPVAAFSFLGVAGTEDFNYNELRQVDESLENAGYVHHLLTFDGIHQWPPKELVPDIFTWLNFDRMRNKTLAVDRKLIDAFIDKHYAEAEAKAKTGDLAGQQAIFMMMKDYLSGLTDVAPLQSEISRLDGDPALIAQKNKMNELLDRERSLQSFYGGKIETENTDWWKKESAKLHAAGDKKPISDESRMYKRVLGYLSLNAYMHCNAALKQDDLASASRFIGVYQLVDPTNAEHRYMAATVSMKQGNTEMALNLLNESVKLGFKEFPRLKSDPVFEQLHTNPRFIEMMKGK